MDRINFPILSILLSIPALTSLIIALLPSKDKTVEQIAELCKRVALISSVVTLGLSAYLFYFPFNPTQLGLQFVEAYPWLGNLSSFKLGTDALSLSMVLLNAVLMPLVVLASDPIAKKLRPKLYYSMLFMLSTAVTGVFLAQDLLVFFVFWELELLPMYLLIAIWGGANKIKAANKFLLFTFLGGAFILAGIIVLFWLSGGQTFSLVDAANKFRAAQEGGLLLPYAGLVNLVFILFAVGFCIKLPSIPVHTWLPEAHVEAPTPISMLLAGVLLKMGAYGLIRFGTEFFPNSLISLSPYLAILGAVNILGAAIFSLVQTDMKRVIAYSSVSHMGFILLGLAALNSQGLNGAIFQMFSHGLISAGLFMVIGVIYERAHTREIAQFSGLANRMPQLFFLFLGLAMANLGLPLLSGFVGESLVFYGAFTSVAGFGVLQWSAAVSTLGVVITAAYMLWLGKRLFFGEISAKWSQITDIRFSEGLVLGILLAGSILLGAFPRLLSDKTEPATINSSETFLRIKEKKAKI